MVHDGVPLHPQLFPTALQRLSRKIVQSRAHSTIIGVFTILLVFVAAFINMVGAWGRGVWGAVGTPAHPSLPSQFACSRVALRDCAAHELNITPEAVGPCQLRTLNFSLGTPAGPCHHDGLACDFPEVSGHGAPMCAGHWDKVLQWVPAGARSSLGAGTESRRMQDAGRRSPLVLCPPGCWNGVPTDAGCWHRSLWVRSPARVLAQGL